MHLRTTLRKYLWLVSMLFLLLLLQRLLLLMHTHGSVLSLLLLLLLLHTLPAKHWCLGSRLR